MNQTQFDTVLMTITPRLNNIETMMHTVLKKLDQLLYEEEIVPQQDEKTKQQDEKTKQQDTKQKLNDPFVDDDEVYTRGQRVPYNKLVGEQVYQFRDFLSHIRMNSSEYSEREVDYASFADKNFSDIRLSDNAKRILESAYFRTYRRQWPFAFIKGYLHKLNDEKRWSWSDGERD